MTYEYYYNDNQIMPAVNTIRTLRATTATGGGEGQQEEEGRGTKTTKEKKSTHKL